MKLTFWIGVVNTAVLIQEMLFQEVGECCIVGHQVFVASHLGDGTVGEHDDVVDTGKPVDSVRHQ